MPQRLHFEHGSALNGLAGTGLRDAAVAHRVGVVPGDAGQSLSPLTQPDR